MFAVLTGASVVAALDACSKGGGAGGNEAPAASAAALATTSPASGTSNRPAPTTNFGVPISPNKCPSAVPGATTTVKELADGIEVTVTAPGGPPINDIRQRGVLIVLASKDPAGGGGSTADGLANCPILVKNAIVKETDVPAALRSPSNPRKRRAWWI
jgi:hypothetical protein